MGLFLGCIFRNFPLKSPGVNISMERLAIWTRTMLSWLWASQEFVSLGTASSFGISDTTVTESDRVHSLSSMGPRIWHHCLSIFLHFLSFSELLSSEVAPRSWSSTFFSYRVSSISSLLSVRCMSCKSAQPRCLSAKHVWWSLRCRWSRLFSLLQ